MKATKNIIAAAFITTVAACGDSSSGDIESNQNGIIVNPETETKYTQGFYPGTIAINGQQTQLLGFTMDEKMLIIDWTGETVISLSDNNNAIYIYSGEELDSRKVVIANTIRTENTASISGEYKDMPFTAQVTYNASATNAIQGVEKGNYASDNGAIAIDEDGNITGSDINGCILNGQSEDLDDYNAKSVTLTITSCVKNGDYKGLIFGITESENVTMVVESGIKLYGDTYQ